MQINRKKLLGAVATVLPAIAKRELFDQADKLIFDGGSLVSYNDEVSIFHPVEEVEGLSGAVDGRRLYDLLNKIPDSVETVNLDVAGAELTVRAGRAKASFAMSEVALPLSEIDRTGDFAALPEGFVGGLRLIAGICARDMSRPVLTCVRFSGDVLEASDGFRMARLFFPGADLPSLLLPVAAAEMVCAFDLTEVAVGEAGEWIRFATAEGSTVCARISSGTFPDLTKLYEVGGETIVLPPALVDVLERAQIFSKRDHKIDEQVTVELRPKRIVVRSEYDGGKFSETVHDAGQIHELSFTIHPDFLSAALKSEGTGCTMDGKKIKFTGPSWEHVVALR